MANHHDTDRRVRKTRTHLHEALASLVHEKPYDEIVVKEILARADVARSTFYAHYRDKDELLQHGIRDMLCTAVARAPTIGAPDGDRLLSFSLPFLEQVERFRMDGELPLDAVRAGAVHQHLERVLESALSDQLRANPAYRASDACVVPAGLLARHVAATFVRTLDWWLEHPTLSARAVDGYFRALVATVVNGALGRSRER